MTTGWPPGLLQDDERKLSRWLASRPDALYQLRKKMTQEDIIAMAREAGGLGYVHDAGDDPHKWQFTVTELQAFIVFVRADEREACLNCYSPDDTAEDWADKIRARGQA